LVGVATASLIQGAGRTQKTKAVVLWIEDSPPIAATGYRMERLRWHLRGGVHRAGAGGGRQEKYAPSVGVTVAILRYGTGVPHYRLKQLQQSVGVPLPASTQWELMVPLRAQAQPIFDALVVLVANAPGPHHDDTTLRILDLRRPGSATADDLARLVPNAKPVLNLASGGSARDTSWLGWRPTARGPAPRTSWRTSRRIRSPDTSPAGSTPAKTWPPGCGNGPRTSRHRPRCAMRCRAMCTGSPPRCWRVPSALRAVAALGKPLPERPHHAANEPCEQKPVMVRYAGDILILCKPSRGAGLPTRLHRWLEARKLTFNEEKTRVEDTRKAGIESLGFSVAWMQGLKRKRGYPHGELSAKSQAKLRDKVRAGRELRTRNQAAVVAV
jgi:Transposase IS66 family